MCLLGGVLGIGLALLLGSMIGRFASDFQVLFSTASIVAAFACSTLIGVAFGCPHATPHNSIRWRPWPRMKKMIRLPFPAPRHLLPAGAVVLALSGCASVGRYPVHDPAVAAQYGRGDATLNAPADGPRSAWIHRPRHPAGHLVDRLRR